VEGDHNNERGRTLPNCYGSSKGGRGDCGYILGEYSSVWFPKTCAQRGVKPKNSSGKEGGEVFARRKYNRHRQETAHKRIAGAEKGRQNLQSFDGGEVPQFPE